MGSVFVRKAKEQNLSLKDIFEKVYNGYKGQNFLTGEYIHNPTPSNFPHILPKGQNKYIWFKYYCKNIVLMSPEQHSAYDAGISRDDREFNSEIENRIAKGLESRRMWRRVYWLKEILLKEYKDWTMTNPKEYKLSL